MARDRDTETPREQFIRDRAEAVGLTITVIAERCGVSRQTLYEWFQPATRLGPDRLLALAVALEFAGDERDALYLAMSRPADPTQPAPDAEDDEQDEEPPTLRAVG